MIELKPHDIAVALKVGLNEMYVDTLPDDLYEDHDYLKAAWRTAPITNSVADLNFVFAMGVSGISRSLNRLKALNLITELRGEGRRKEYVMNCGAMADLLCHSVRHIFQPEPQGNFRGIPCGWHCPFIESEMNPPERPLVWKMSLGPVSGEAVEPLFPNIGKAVTIDPGLYKALSLVELIRLGKPRDVNHARRVLKDHILGMRRTKSMKI